MVKDGERVDQQATRPGSSRRALVVRRSDDRWAGRLTIWAIWALMLGGVGRETLGQTQLVSFGFYTLHVVDPGVLLSFLAWGAFQVRRPLRGGILVAPVGVIALLVLMNFVRGLSVDVATALLNARSNLASAGLLLLAMSCDLSPAIWRAYRTSLIGSAMLLAMLVLLRLALGPTLFMTFDAVAADQINDGGRVLSAFGAFTIGLAAALLLSELLRKGMSRSPRRAAMLATLLIAEIATGQGTATIAMLSMLAVVLTIERGAFHGPRLTLGIGLLAAVAIVTMGGDVLASLASDGGGAFDFAQRSRNLDTRLAVWSALKIGFAQQPAFNQLFGMAAGQLPSMIVNLPNQTVEWTLSIHSMYYGSLPVMGYIGLSAYIFLLIALSLGFLIDALRGRAPRAPAYPLAMCIGTAVLSFSYEIRNAMLIGLFIAIYWHRATQQRTVPNASPRRVGRPARPTGAGSTSGRGRPLVPRSLSRSRTGSKR